MKNQPQDEFLEGEGPLRSHTVSLSLFRLGLCGTTETNIIA